MTTSINQQVYLHHSCRVCREPLQEILNLGNLHLNAFPKNLWEIPQIPRVHLILTLCSGCGLLQLDRTVPQDWLYREYWYRSGVNEMMIRELFDLAQQSAEIINLRPGDVVVDIGANDGTLLHGYEQAGYAGIRRVAMEPALNLTESLRRYTDEISTAYFPTSALSDYYGRASIVTAIAMMYDLEDPVAGFTEIRKLLAPGGIGVVQFQDFAQQLQASAFDNICHEHLEYYTLWSVQRIVQVAGLQVVKVQRRAINGGSLRVILKRATDNPAIDPSVGAQLVLEMQLGLDTPTIRDGNSKAFDQFAQRITTAKQQIHAAVQQVVDAGLVMDVYGASTKGNILLQVMGITPDVARQAIDRSQAKWGHHTITGIPIVSERTAQREPADVWLSPIWQFRESVLEREKWYLEQGGTIVFPLPQVEVVKESWKAPDGAPT